MKAGMTTESLSLGDQWRIYREEGMPSLQNRNKALAEEQKRVRKLAKISERDGRIEFAAGNPLVLNVAFLPAPFERLANHSQLLDRLNEEKMFRTVALAYHRGDGWSLEVWSKSAAGILDLGDVTNPVEAIAQAARLVKARIIHIEGLKGLPLHLVQSLDDRDFEVILSVHDFTPFCARPHLIEQPGGRFCEFCTNMPRCDSCLQGADLGGQRNQTGYRKAGAEAIRQARVLIYPSAFMQRQIQTLFPRRQAVQNEVVLAPATRSSGLEPWNSDRVNIAFVGGVQPHSGANLIAPTMEQILKRDKKAKGFVYGSGDSAFLKGLRKAKGLTVTGYYQHGTLSSLLARDKIAVAVFPSIWPDPYGLVVDECLAVGVPVIAFDLGAVADRLNFWEVGRVVRRQHGAPGLATAVFDSFGTGNKVPNDIIKTVPSTARMARRHWELYKSLRVRIR
jgi:glycosyltransferase involved in cell wall biosynthesis